MASEKNGYRHIAPDDWKDKLSAIASDLEKLEADQPQTASIGLNLQVLSALITHHLADLHARLGDARDELAHYQSLTYSYISLEESRDAASDTSAELKVKMREGNQNGR
jgi:hypothetical protein